MRVLRTHFLTSDDPLKTTLRKKAKISLMVFRYVFGFWAFPIKYISLSNCKEIGSTTPLKSQSA